MGVHHVAQVFLLQLLQHPEDGQVVGVVHPLPRRQRAAFIEVGSKRDALLGQMHHDGGEPVARTIVVQVHRWPAKVHPQGVGERHVHVFRSYPAHVQVEYGLACGVADHLSLGEDSGAAHVVVVFVGQDDSRDGLVGDVGDGTFQRLGPSRKRRVGDQYPVFAHHQAGIVELAHHVHVVGESLHRRRRRHHRCHQKNHGTCEGLF